MACFLLTSNQGMLLLLTFLLVSCVFLFVLCLFLVVLVCSFFLVFFGQQLRMLQCFKEQPD